MLFEKLIGEDVPERISINAFAAAFAEGVRDQLGEDTIAAMFELEADDLGELAELVDIVQALPLNRQAEFGAVLRDTLILASAGVAYETAAEWFSRLREFV